MVQFKSSELESRLRTAIEYVYDTVEYKQYFFIDEFTYNHESHSFESETDLLITEDLKILLTLGKSDVEFELTVGELINLINEAKDAQIIDNCKVISKKRVLIKVEGSTFEDILFVEMLLDNDFYKIPSIESKIDGNKVKCSIINGATLFGLITYLNNNYTSLHPPVLYNDKFVEIYFIEGSLSNIQIDSIYNAFLFELSASLNINLQVDKRASINNSDDIFDRMEFPSSRIRPLIYGQGIDEVIKLFNDASRHSGNYNYSIIQYTKVIEYISQTVIKEDLTKKALQKLNSNQALRPDANYIQELEQLFVNNKTMYESDKNAIKATIEVCCNMDEIFEFAPEYLKKVKSYKAQKKNPKANLDDLKKQAIDEICQAVSDTRNSLSHAKANYTAKGCECPESEKFNYLIMLKYITIQVIRWFNSVSEVNRIT